MKRRGALLWVTLAASAAAYAQAPEEGDRARLEDFAVSGQSDTLRVEQLSDQATALPVAQPAADRALARPPAPAPHDPSLVQLTNKADNRATSQLSDAADSRVLRPAEVSSPTDSAPGAVVRLGGRDRCEPRLDREALAECLRILELRADEFNAPAPPKLSAEERILAEQRQREQEMGLSSPAMRLRFATSTEPDADLPSNQVLASIYLDTQQPGPTPLPEELPEGAAGLAELLQGLGLDPGSPPPDQQ